MIDKSKFMEMLGDLTEIAATQGNSISPEEIKEYFKELELTEEHYKLIYAFLAEKQVIVNGFENSEAEQKEDLKEEDSVFLKMYMKELKTLEKLTKDEEMVLFREVQNEIPGARERLIHVWLPKVVRIAKKYKNQGVFLEDLIQEGNIGLLGAVDNLALLGDGIDAPDYLKKQIIRAMQMVIDENMDEDDLENTVVGRSNLIKEASNVLAEDLGRVATLEELAEYTKLPLEEIQDILTLSLDAIETGKGE